LRVKCARSENRKAQGQIAAGALNRNDSSAKKEKEEMNKVKFSYLKLMAVAAVLAITLIGLSGLLSMRTAAQDRVELPTRELDLREKLKDKKFADGRRVEIQTLDAGEKIVAELKNGQFLNWYLVNAEGTEVKGEFKRKPVTTTVAVCTETFVSLVTTTVNGVTTTKRNVSIIQIPCPPLKDLLDKAK
jgi:hypothetical protein